MAHSKSFRDGLCACLVIGFTLTGTRTRAQDSADTKEQLRLLQQQNSALQEQLRKQQSLIESLTRKVNGIEEANDKRGRELQHLESQLQDPAPAAKSTTRLDLAKVNISGEGGAVFFHGGSKGIFPHSEFRVDEAKLFVEAPIWGTVYFFGELNLMTREAQDLGLRLGELYLDIENVSKLWNREGMLNVRLGRMDIPFGEEYQVRDVIDNPLISRSIVDLWGVDEGIELYGTMGKVSYAAAVQNGGPSGIRDFDADKSIAGRISFDPTQWLHLSGSAMRTGNLDVARDSWSEMWFANAWLLPTGPTVGAKFHANLFEGDIEVRLPRGHLKAFGGYIYQDDNSSTANNRREIYYYSLEAVHDMTHKIYAGARFGQIFANHGYPISGNGDMGNYLFSGTLTESLWRLSLGLGYRWNQNFVTKAEYSFEGGRTVGGGKRNHEDLFGVEAAYKF
jgi:hypothetical protein